MKNKKTFYHITASKNIKDILLYGLKANEDGHIFIFDTLEAYHDYFGFLFVPDQIASNQVFLQEYVLLKINRKGITEKMENDNVAELTNQFHGF